MGNVMLKLMSVMVMKPLSTKSKDTNFREFHKVVAGVNEIMNSGLSFDDAIEYCHTLFKEGHPMPWEES